MRSELRNAVFMTALVAFAPSAQAAVFAEECRAQYLDEASDTIACEARFEPSTEAVDAVVNAGTPGPELDAFKTMLQTSKCLAAVEVPKSQVKASWFTGDTVDIPELPVSCEMVDATGATLNVTTLAKVDCDKPAGDWACQAAIRETTGLSFMGGLLEGMVNGNPDLSARVATVVRELSAGLGVED